MLQPEIAEKIVNEVRKLLDEQLIITDKQGIIIASSDSARLGSFHEGAKVACETEQVLFISKADETRLTGVRAGMNLPIFFNGAVIGVIGITGLPEKVKPYGELIRKMTELFIQENYVHEQIEWQERTLEAYVFDWLQGSDWQEAFYRRGEFLEIDLEVSRVCILIHFQQQEKLMNRSLRHWVTQWLKKDDRDVLVRWGTDRFLLLKADDGWLKQEELREGFERFCGIVQERFHVEVKVGIGQRVKSELVSQSFQQAERALASASVGTGKQVVFEDSLQLEVLLQEISDSAAVDFIHRTIGQILSEDGLLLTLRAFLAENLSLKGTAERLHVHINTLHYRLMRIEELTGLTPKRSHDQTILYLALMILDKHPNQV